MVDVVVVMRQSGGDGWTSEERPDAEFLFGLALANAISVASARALTNIRPSNLLCGPPKQYLSIN